MADCRREPSMPCSDLCRESVAVVVSCIRASPRMLVADPLLAQPVRDVRRLAAEHEMGGSYAPRVVAQVQHLQPVGERVVAELPSDAGRLGGPAEIGVVQQGTAVGTGQCPQPRPAPQRPLLDR